MKIIQFSLRCGPGARFVRFPFPLNGSPLSCALSLRAAGDMVYDPESPNRNRSLLFAEVGVAPEKVAARRQTHSKDVAAVDASSVGRAGPGDGFATADQRLVLSVTVADCLPIFLADERTGAFALLHSGWKGTGIVVEALRLMKGEWGSDPADIAAVLGPCIRGCCYEVDGARADAFDADFPSVRGGNPLGPATRTDGSRRFIDLQAANAAMLEAAGVRSLAVCTDCTFTDDRLGSFRREGSDRFTRMAALLGRLPEETEA